MVMAAGNLALAKLLPDVLAVTGVWDGENRPTSFSVYYGTPLGGPTNLSTSFVYNGDGQMVQKTDTAGVTRKFVWDAQNILQETDLADATQLEYTLKPQLYGDLISHRRGSASRYYHCDAQGSVNALTDAAQSVQDIYVYDAWGNQVLTWENTENNFRYIGRQGYYRYSLGLGDQDSSYQVRARHYAPNQWLSRDPWGLRADEQNDYVYTASRPTASVDPSGELYYDSFGVKLSGLTCASQTAEVSYVIYLSSAFGAPCNGFVVQEVTFDCTVDPFCTKNCSGGLQTQMQSRLGHEPLKTV